MNMVEFIIGAAVGAAGGYVAKDTLFGGKNGGKQVDLERELDKLSDENEKLRKRNKEAERRIEDLVAENESLIKRGKDVSEDHNDLEDERDMLKAKVKILQAAKDELERKLQEYRIACESLQNEVNTLKSK